MPSLARRAVPLPAAIVLLLLVSLARAQPLFDDLPTLEWRTAQADLVITARILDFEIEFGDYGVSRLGLTLGTIETIKGDAAPVLEVSIDSPGVLDSVAEGLASRRDAGAIDAWFLTSQPGTGAFGGIGHGLHASMLPLADWPTVDKPGSWLRRPLPPAVTMDFVRHDGKDAMLDSLRRIVEDEPQHVDPRVPLAGHSLQMSMLFDEPLWPEAVTLYMVSVPADLRLESLARRMIEHPASFFAPLPETASDKEQRNRASVHAIVRHEGAKALASHFQKEENARLLATLLDDPSTSQYRPSGLGEPTRHLFTTRKIAFDALTEWSVEVPRPELQAPMVDASIAPSEGAVRAVHGPRGDGVITAELLFELGGDHTPELLRVYLAATDQPTASPDQPIAAIDLERLRTEGVTCLGFSVFTLADGQAVLTLHAGGNAGPITLTLERPDWRTRLVVRDPEGQTEPLLYGQWDTRGEEGGPFWEARAGTWNTRMHRFDTSARKPPIGFIAAPSPDTDP
ncbi:hypothetical protein AY599_27635 [Leptolyngbya valderiana BDU 20041]|nr:hypothetical protein AY599_27635 [Leptolyngbya valderiana BDU 20041]